MKKDNGIRFRLDDDMERRLAAIAESQGVSKSDVIREALRKFLFNPNPRDNITPEVAAELAKIAARTRVRPDALIESLVAALSEHVDRHNGRVTLPLRCAEDEGSPSPVPPASHAGEQPQYRIAADRAPDRDRYGVAADPVPPGPVPPASHAGEPKARGDPAPDSRHMGKQGGESVTGRGDAAAPGVEKKHPRPTRRQHPAPALRP